MNIEGLSGREEQEAIKIVEIDVNRVREGMIPVGTAHSIINKIKYGNQKDSYDPI